MDKKRFVYSREDLTEHDVCHNCRRDLRAFKEIHSVEGMLFCSEECAIAHETYVIMASAKEQAKAWYNDFAEVVAAEDIGISDYDSIWTAHSSTNDITTIFKTVYEHGAIVSTEVVGFYFGEPNDAETQKHTGQLKATF